MEYHCLNSSNDSCPSPFSSHSSNAWLHKDTSNPTIKRLHNTSLDAAEIQSDDSTRRQQLSKRTLAAVALASSDADTPLEASYPGCIWYMMLNTDVRYCSISGREMKPLPSRSASGRHNHQNYSGGGSK